MNSIALIAFTQSGCVQAQALIQGLAALPDYQDAHFSFAGPARLAEEFPLQPYANLNEWAAEHFAACDALVFVSAAGIAVRAIAPFVRDKFTDPAVVSVDEAGQFVIPLLSGHVGGANQLARTIAQLTGGQAVISTATDVNKVFAVDEWAVRNGLCILERAVAKQISADLLQGKPVGFTSSLQLPVPPSLPEHLHDNQAQVGFTVSLSETVQPFQQTLHLVPHAVTVGVGCRKGISAQVLHDAVFQALEAADVAPCAVTTLASIDVKEHEPAIQALARAEGWRLQFYSAQQLNAVPGTFAESGFVESTVGVGNVCERAACAEGGTLIAGKQAHEGTTVALALNTWKLND